MWNIRGYDTSSGRVYVRILLETSDISICFWLRGIVIDKGKPSKTSFALLSKSFSASLVLYKLLPIPAFSDFTTRTQLLQKSCLLNIFFTLFVDSFKSGDTILIFEKYKFEITVSMFYYILINRFRDIFLNVRLMLIPFYHIK